MDNLLINFAVTNESKKTELYTAAADVSSSERSEGDKIVDGMDFGELCNEFECISSPLVEATSRQLVRDILELREGNRALGTYATSVKYKVSISPVLAATFSNPSSIHEKHVFYTVIFFFICLFESVVNLLSHKFLEKEEKENFEIDGIVFTIS